MPTTSTPTAKLAGNLAGIAQCYFDSLADGDFARVPWSADVVLQTPLRSDGPVRGRKAVEAFFRPMTGQLGDIRVVATYTSDRRDVIVTEAFVGPLHVLDKFVIRDGEIVEQENVFDPRPVLDAVAPGGLSFDERALLIEMLKGSRDRFRKAVENAPDANWGREPRGGGWSASECAEHLVLSEEALLKLVRETILAGTADPGLVAELRGKDGVIVQAMQDRSAKSKTFDFLEPSGRWSTRASARDAFLARRAETIEYVQVSRDPVHHHAAPLGPLGLLDAYHWLLLMAAHTDRHIAQLEDALGL